MAMADIMPSPQRWRFPKKTEVSSPLTQLGGFDPGFEKVVCANAWEDAGTLSA
jgi:hypothetical protein